MYRKRLVKEYWRRLNNTLIKSKLNAENLINIISVCCASTLLLLWCNPLETTGT